MIINEESKIIFIHIPRTGGTSVRELFDFPLWGHQCFASSLKEQLGHKYNEYFKFTIVRNPWDRMVSYYHFLKDDPIGTKYSYPGGLADDESFKSWIMRRFGPGSQIHPNGDYYTKKWLGDYDGNILVDHIIKFENFEEELQPILDKYELNKPIPHLNKSIREPYQEYYDDESKEIVRENFAKDIILFGYKFSV